VNTLDQHVSQTTLTQDVWHGGRVAKRIYRPATTRYDIRSCSKYCYELY